MLTGIEHNDEFYIDDDKRIRWSIFQWYEMNSCIKDVYLSLQNSDKS